MFSVPGQQAARTVFLESRESQELRPASALVSASAVCLLWCRSPRRVWWSHRGKGRGRGWNLCSLVLGRSELCEGNPEAGVCLHTVRPSSEQLLQALSRVVTPEVMQY